MKEVTRTRTTSIASSRTIRSGAKWNEEKGDNEQAISSIRCTRKMDRGLRGHTHEPIEPCKDSTGNGKIEESLKRHHVHAQ
jgi:hypothetical protein